MAEPWRGRSRGRGRAVAVALADPDGPAAALATAHEMKGTTLWHMGQVVAAHESFEVALIHIDRLDANERRSPILSQVVQTLRLGPDDVQRLGGREVTLVREDLVPLLRLREAFQSHGESQGSRFGEAVLVVEVAQGLVGLVVDAFHEGIEAVVKPLTGLMATLPYVSGTTLLGDGQVLLVLDLEDLSHAHHLHADHRAPATDDQRRGGGAAAAVAGGAS